MITWLWILMALGYVMTLCVLFVAMTGTLSTAGFIMVPLWAILGTLAGSAAALLEALKKK